MRREGILVLGCLQFGKFKYNLARLDVYFVVFCVLVF